MADSLSRTDDRGTLMKVAHIDGCSGVSGDMLLGALLDAGLRLTQLKTDLSRLRLPPFRLSTQRVQRGSIAARLVTVTPVRAARRQPTYAQILRLVKQSRLSPWVIEHSTNCLQALQNVESTLHGGGLPEAFVGTNLTDTLVDIVGVISGVHRLGLQQLSASPLNLGGGLIHNGHHDELGHASVLPAPSPAAARLLIGYSVYSEGPPVELTTPTGAALIRTLTDGSSSLPPMRLTTIGHGAGHYELGHWPNLVRLLIGEGFSKGFTTPAGDDRVMQIETNLDDCNPQLYEHLTDRLFSHGALDVYLTPIIMKRGRPATQVTLLASPERAAELTEIMFDETPTLGVRIQEVYRRTLPREIRRLSTPQGPVRVKIIRTASGMETRPEYRDCRVIAQRTGMPLRSVIRRIERLAERRFRQPKRSPRSSSIRRPWH